MNRPIRYRIDESIFNLRRLQTKTNVSTDTINDFVFAEDRALNTASETAMQYSVDKLSDTCNNFGMTLSTKKTEVMHQPVQASHTLRQVSPSTDSD